MLPIGRLGLIVIAAALLVIGSPAKPRAQDNPGPDRVVALLKFGREPYQQGKYKEATERSGRLHHHRPGSVIRGS